MKHFLMIASVAALSASSALANDICGDIAQVSIPSYRLSLVTPDGSAVPKLNVTGQVITEEAVWQGDHWGSVSHSFTIPVAYDAAAGNYATTATTVKPATRWKSLDPFCRDKIISLTFTFNASPKNAPGYLVQWNRADFSYSFPETGSEFALPSATKIIAVDVLPMTVMTGYFTSETEFQPEGATPQIQTTWQGLSTADPSAIGLTAAEITLIGDSVSGRAQVTIYGNPLNDGDAQFVVLNIGPAAVAN